MKSICCSIVFLLALWFGVPSVLAQEAPGELGKVSQKLTALEEKVRNLKTAQTQIVQKQSEIKKELDSLRIWIAHRGG